MKLTIALILVLNFQVVGSGYSQTSVTLNLKSAGFKKVISEIEKKTSYRFVYSERNIPTEKYPSINVDDQDVLTVVRQLLDGTSFTYQQLRNNLIAIIPQGVVISDIRVSGKVTDEAGEPMIGASVKIKGVAEGTTTDINGAFNITAPENAVLTISYIGYDVMEIPIDGRASLSVKLTASTRNLNEVVVVGYGTQRRADVTGSIASVNTTTITRAATTDATGALQGNTPGVNVVKNVGKPGSGYSINVRGISSLGGTNSPLVVIDGIPGTSGINDLNPADIEKIDILKDASATAIYGSRGAKGVVMITTKRGKAGKTLITYDAYAGVRSPVNMPDMMTGQEYVDFRTEMFKGQGRASLINRSNTTFFTPEQWKNIDEGNFTDWPSMVVQNGLQMNHNITASGGDEKTRFALGAGLLREEGNISPEDFKRYSLRGNVDRQISEKWKAGVNFYLSQNLQNNGSFEAIRSAYRLPPIVSNSYEVDGKPVLRVYGNDGVVNPLLDQENDLRENRSLSTFGNIYLQVEPIRHLTLKTTFSPSFRNGRTAWYVGINSKEGVGQGGFNRATGGMNENFTWIWDNQATYEREFGAKHKLTVTAIQSLLKERAENNSISVFGLPFRSLWYNVGSATNTLANGTFQGPTVGSGFTQFTLASARFRTNYSYNDKYLLTVSGTWDGSSKLSEGNKWGFFPSASVAWKLSEEAFLKNISAINDLKLRLSYGESGNDRIASYSTQATLTRSTYFFGTNLAQGYSPGQLANKDLTWETTREVNLGADFGLFNNRISGTVDVYNRVISDLLLDRNLPAPSGWGSITSNVGKLRNNGVEVALSTINIKAGKFTWKSDFVFDANKNRILETANGRRDDVGRGLFIGQPVQVNYDYVFDGIWQLGQETEALKYAQKPGQVRVKDISGPAGVPDGKITADYDRQIIGKRVPNWTGSFANSFKYSNLDLYVMAYTRRGEQYSSNYHSSFTNFNQNYNQIKANYWTAENPSQEHHQPGNPGNFVNASYYKASDFVRISNITLGYTVPAKVLQKARINNLRLYATATNPFLFSKYDGYDPEWATQNTYGTAVSTASYLFGLNLGF